MTGAEEYKNKFEKLILNKLEEVGDENLYMFYYYLSNSKNPSTCYNYINYVVGFIRKLNITDFKTITFNSYIKYLALIKDESPSYRIAVYHALEKFSTYLYINKITDNYMEHIERPSGKEKKETKEKREEGFFTKEELKAAFNAVLNSSLNEVWKQRDYTLLLLLLSSGIRSSALEKLDVNDIDFYNNEIIVTEKRSEVRKIMLPQDTIDEIKKWMSFREDMNLSTTALFVSNQRKRMNQKSIYRVVNKYTGKHPHTFRATFGTTIYDNTGDLFFTQKCMGHSSPKTTELYIRGESNKIAEKASSIMSNCIKSL